MISPISILIQNILWSTTVAIPPECSLAGSHLSAVGFISQTEIQNISSVDTTFTITVIPAENEFQKLQQAVPPLLLCSNGILQSGKLLCSPPPPPHLLLFLV